MSNEQCAMCNMCVLRNDSDCPLLIANNPWRLSRNKTCNPLDLSGRTFLCPQRGCVLKPRLRRAAGPPWVGVATEAQLSCGLVGGFLGSTLVGVELAVAMIPKVAAPTLGFG